MKRKRMYISLAGVAVLLLAILLVPLPHRVFCTLEIQLRDPELVYVTVPGRLDEIQVEAGQEVAEGQPLARLENLDIDLEITDLAGQADAYRQQRKNLYRQRFDDPQAGAQIASVSKALQTVEERLAGRKGDLRRLQLLAPASGTLFPPPSTPKPRQSEDELPTWSGTPLEPENLGCYMEEGQLFCQVGDPTRMEAILVIDQADIEFIRKGQVVEINLDSLPQQTFTYNLIEGRKQKLTIEEVARSDLKISPVRLSAKGGGELATKSDAAGMERPMSASYQARVSLDDPQAQLLPGLCGQVKIKVGSQPLGTRLYRWLVQTINFKL